MSMELTVIQQTAVMFLMMAAGYLLFRSKKITVEGSRSIASTLLYLVIPSVIINTFLAEKSAEKLQALLLSAAVSILVLMLAVIAARLVFPDSPIDDFAAAFSNAGFIGIPLVQSVLGNDAVFYISAFIVFINLFQWIYGAPMMRNEKIEFIPRKLLINPVVIGMAIGLFLFFTQIPVPGIIRTCLSSIQNLNAPLAMLVLGVYLAQTDISSMFRTPALYKMAAVRLLLIPALTMAVLSILPSELNSLRIAILISASAPAGANAAVYAQVYGGNYSYAVKCVTLTTILSIITLPVIIGISSVLWK
ncbi:AEC family transporter [Murimonas intestini]|uniref:AEC family transporter n=1 Tax=Murimonas intestini TaxID=1337051 RepID=UPI0011DDFF0A|nr:AEC family transporter [Murimonas intestini]